MDISTKHLDLLYLSRGKVGKEKEKKEKKYKKSDLNKYKKRIFEQCRDILMGNKTTPEIDNIFDDYIKMSIEHFKFLDKRDTIQKDYTNIKNKNEKLTKIDYDETNKIMFKQDKPVHIKITDCIAVKKKNKAKKKMIIPRQRDYNKREQTKSKAAPAKPNDIVIRYDKKKKIKKKENMNIKYDEDKTKK